MTAPYKHEVEKFINYFEDQAVAIAGVKTPLHRIILYTTALDPLARAAYGAGLTHRARIIKLINELSGWTDCVRISLPQLQQLLRKKRRYRYKLYRDVSTRLNQWQDATSIPLSESPMEATLTPLAQSDELKQIRACQYAELLYTYRNNLVHEFREPGYGWDVSGKWSEPYYMSYIDKPWELVFPVRFFESVLIGTLNGLQGYLIQNKINPYKRFEFGTLWSAK
jgi:hypothetical protein